MITLAEVEDKVKLIAQELTDRAESLVHEAAPVVHDAADTLTKLSQSKIVSELMQYGEDILPADTVTAITSLIHDAGEAATKIAALTAPPAEPAAEAPAG